MRSFERIGAVNLDEAMRDYESLPRMVRRKIFNRVLGGWSGNWINRSLDWDIKFLRRQAVHGTAEGQKDAAACMEEARRHRR